MRIAVTGPDGFLAWHVRCNLQARTGQDAILISRNELENPDLLIKSLEHCSAVIHLAALNRDAPDEVILTNNVSTTLFPLFLLIRFMLMARRHSEFRNENPQKFFLNLRRRPVPFS